MRLPVTLLVAVLAALALAGCPDPPYPSATATVVTIDPAQRPTALTRCPGFNRLPHY